MKLFLFLLMYVCLCVCVSVCVIFTLKLIVHNLLQTILIQFWILKQ